MGHHANAKVTQGSATWYKKTNAQAMHCQDTALCKRDLRQCNMVQKAVHGCAFSRHSAVQKRPKAVQSRHERQFKKKSSSKSINMGSSFIDLDASSTAMKKNFI
jgi:hypothetical protein